MGVYLVIVGVYFVAVGLYFVTVGLYFGPFDLAKCISVYSVFKVLEKNLNDLLVVDILPHDSLSERWL